MNGVLSGGYGQQRLFRFSSEKDLIYVTHNVEEMWIWEDHKAFWSAETLRCVRNLALDSRILDEIEVTQEQEGESDMVFLAGFWRLEKLIVVVHGHDWDVHDICRRGWNDTGSPGFRRTDVEELIQCYKQQTKRMIRFEHKSMRRRGKFYSHHMPKILVRIGLRDGEKCCHSDCC